VLTLNVLRTQIDSKTHAHARRHVYGKPATAGSITSELERAAVEAIKDAIIEKLRPLSAPLGENLKVEIVGSNLDNLKINLSGPQELIDEAKDLVGAK